MYEVTDLRPLTWVVPLPAGLGENDADERGWWPVLAFTDDVRPVVLELNLN